MTKWDEAIEHANRLGVLLPMPQLIVIWHGDPTVLGAYAKQVVWGLYYKGEPVWPGMPEDDSTQPVAGVRVTG